MLPLLVNHFEPLKVSFAEPECYLPKIVSYRLNNGSGIKNDFIKNLTNFDDLTKMTKSILMSMKIFDHLFILNTFFYLKKKRISLINFFFA